MQHSVQPSMQPSVQPSVQTDVGPSVLNWVQTSVPSLSIFQCTLQCLPSVHILGLRCNVSADFLCSLQACCLSVPHMNSLRIRLRNVWTFNRAFVAFFDAVFGTFLWTFSEALSTGFGATFVQLFSAEVCVAFGLSVLSSVQTLVPRL